MDRSAGLDAIEVIGEDQLGVIRWCAATSEMDQIYVAPQGRRRHLASVLIAAASTLSDSRDWRGCEETGNVARWARTCATPAPGGT